jgi:hypothetical protein
MRLGRVFVSSGFRLRRDGIKVTRRLGNLFASGLGGGQIGWRRRAGAQSWASAAAASTTAATTGPAASGRAGWVRAKGHR